MLDKVERRQARQDLLGRPLGRAAKGRCQRLGTCFGINALEHLVDFSPVAIVAVIRDEQHRGKHISRILADILLDCRVEAAGIGVGVECRMLVTEELPILVKLVALDLEAHGLARVPLDLEVVAIGCHKGGQKVALDIEQGDNDGLCRHSLEAEVPFLVHGHGLVNHARIAPEDNPDDRPLKSRDVALDLEAAAVASDQQQGGHK